MFIPVLNSKNSFANPSSSMDFHLWKKNPVALHKHTFYEFIFIQKGPVTHLVNNKRIVLQPGTLTLVRPNDEHSFIFDENTSPLQANLAIKADFFESFFYMFYGNLLSTINNSSNEIYFQLSKVEISQINYWINKINLEFNAENAQQSTNITSLLLSFVAIFINYVKTSQNSYPNWFSNILNTINSQDFIDKTPADIYTLFPMSTPNTIKVFKKYLNETPVEYLTKLKMNYACNLLKYTNYTTLNISIAIGYTSLSHFNHTFKKIKGLTPIQYRNQFSQGNPS